jgi:hypothetical protein|tara:strand:- start:711 stop:1259 length:549 start_codon:yes stop_codon:yes gene_type:complete
MKFQGKNSHTVKVYNKIFTEDMGYALIEAFENSEHGHEYVNKDHKPCFTQLNVNEHCPELIKVLVNWTKIAYHDYVTETKNNYIPNFKHLEEFRIKRYKTGREERFDEHVDVTDYASAKRALAFLFYLNDNDGDTYFPNHDIRIHPKAGSILVFPPTWEYPHIGYPPTLQQKYIVSTYLHYG